MNSRTMRRAAVVAAVCVLALAACTTVVHKPASDTKLTSARVGDTISLSWPSVKGAHYWILCAASRDATATWTQLPGCENVEGTGDLIERKDTVPEGQLRYYRIVTLPPGAKLAKPKPASRAP